jgi:hypothetical protein
MDEYLGQPTPRFQRNSKTFFGGGICKSNYKAWRIANPIIWVQHRYIVNNAADIIAFGNKCSNRKTRARLVAAAFDPAQKLAAHPAGSDNYERFHAVMFTERPPSTTS